MQPERKKIIQYALNFDISDIHTYSGYKGDLVTKITSKEKSAVIDIRRFALSLGIEEIVIKQNPSINEFEIYCITVDENVYNLKPYDTHDDRNHSNFTEDIWEKTILQ